MQTKTRRAVFGPFELFNNVRWAANAYYPDSKERSSRLTSKTTFWFIEVSFFDWSPEIDHFNDLMNYIWLYETR